MTKTWAIYTRTALDTVSTDAQRVLVEQFVANNGWLCLSERYDDQGASGRNLQRPALQSLLRDVQDGKIDRVIVSDLARLSRSAEDLRTIMDILQQHGVSLVIVAAEAIQ